MGKIPLSLLFFIFITGCKEVDKAPILSEGKMIEIKQGTVANIGKLKIGVIRIDKLDNKSDSGKLKNTLVARLSLFISEEKPEKKNLDVVAGDKIQIGKYSIYVVEIRGRVKGTVVLQVKVLN